VVLAAATPLVPLWLRASLQFTSAGDVGPHTVARDKCGKGHNQHLLIRRNIADGDFAFFSTWCPVGTGIETLVMIEGHRWAIEDSFETAKNELGLDHNETRSWHGWHRHVSLVMLAFAMMAAIRHRANSTTPKKRSAG
jgi:SRSO17 transposase